MKILILGGDGYLGWPQSMHFAMRGHEVVAIDNYLRRKIAAEMDSKALFDNPELPERTEIFRAATNHDIQYEIGDLADSEFTDDLFRRHKPEVVLHLAEQPSAPYSMAGFDQAKLTFNNNLNTTFNVIWGIINNVPDCHLIKLGTMGEYGTPNIDIEEGWLDVSHNGREDRFLFPRQAGSLYHTSKVLDTDLLWFYVRLYGLRVTDLMQGPVYGLVTDGTVIDPRLAPNFHYDDIFGTVLNRFLVQAVVGTPLTVYGKGGQTRGYLDIRDTMQCIDLALQSPADKGELRIFNQFVEQFTVLELAERINRAGKLCDLDVEISNIPNPRKELEDHYYNAKHSGLSELGLKPHFLTDEVLAEMLQQVQQYRDQIDESLIHPRVSWSGK